MKTDNRFRRLREVLCSTAFRVAPLTSMIVGIPLIGHSLAFALCPSTRSSVTSSLQRKEAPSAPDRTHEQEPLPVEWRDFFFALESDTQDHRE